MPGKFSHSSAKYAAHTVGRCHPGGGEQGAATEGPPLRLDWETSHNRCSGGPLVVGPLAPAPSTGVTPVLKSRSRPDRAADSARGASRHSYLGVSLWDQARWAEAEKGARLVSEAPRRGSVRHQTSEVGLATRHELVYSEAPDRPSHGRWRTNMETNSQPSATAATAKGQSTRIWTRIGAAWTRAWRHGSGRTLLGWFVLVYGLFLVRSWVQSGSLFLALEGIALFASGVAIQRRSAASVAWLLALGAGFGLMDTLLYIYENSFDLLILTRAAIQVVAMTMGIRGIRSSGWAEGHLTLSFSPERPHRVTVNKDVRTYTFVCIATGTVYLVFGLLAAIFSIYVTSMLPGGAPDLMPEWLALVVESGLFLGFAFHLQRGFETGRIVVLVLSGAFALDFAFELLAGNTLTAWDVVSFIAWTYGFVLLGTRGHLVELAATASSDDEGQTPTQMLEQMVEVAKKFDNR